MLPVKIHFVYGASQLLQIMTELYVKMDLYKYNVLNKSTLLLLHTAKYKGDPTPVNAEGRYDIMTPLT